MRVFYDSEFVERGPAIPIQPISFGFVADSGEELYVINADSLSNLMRHQWVSLNVSPSLPIQQDDRFIFQWDKEHPEYDSVMALDSLVQEVQKFLTQFDDVELWADYGAYDHVVLCQLFGAMNELPPGVPMYTNELQQLSKHYPGVQFPPAYEVTHHALWDARWARDVYNTLVGESVTGRHAAVTKVEFDEELLTRE